jgi:hypothetical protein
VLVSVWTLGFSAPVERVREAWLRLLDQNLEARIQAKVAKGQTRADVLTAEAQPAIRKVRRLFDVERADIDLAALEVGDMIFDPAYLFDETANQTLYESLKRVAADKKLFGNAAPDGRKFDLRAIVDFLRATQSPEEMKTLLSRAAHDELIYARDFRLRTWELIAKAVPGSRTMTMPEIKVTWSQHWALVLGRHAIPSILHLAKLGHRSRLEHALSLATDIAGEFNLMEAISELFIAGKLHPRLAAIISELMRPN